uniref:Major facilitator superfamily (MFS) profile domain-containing protein n=1 Tax=Timema tahoe TaxID=61484 RepID=A0A7R9IPM6_9NEOP|nr:unnamed protein product [Timema tahoe]
MEKIESSDVSAHSSNTDHIKEGFPWRDSPVTTEILSGIVQTTGWPGVVSAVGKWFGKEKRGLIFGIWNSHTSIGNILGSVIAGEFVETNWGVSFIVPGAIIAFGGFIIFLFLVENPSNVHCDLPTSGDDKGVVEFSLCLFFAKLVSYTFLYWLPLYIRSSTTLGPALSGDLSTLFDVGGIVGGIAAGVVSDYTGMYATTCSVMLTFAAPMLFVYEKFGTNNFSVNIILLLIAGLLVNGPYALITTAVSAELGTHHSLQGNSKALATVTAIIDGTGSIGAAVGPLLAGVISSRGWENVFYMLIISDIIALMVNNLQTSQSELIWHSLICNTYYRAYFNSIPHNYFLLNEVKF